ncbi:MAG TPA: S8 family peptidase [Pyrinomonadaceae bacterium]
MRRPEFIKQLVTMAVLISLCTALVVSTNTKAKAALMPLPTSKVSPDLRELINSGNGNQRVKLIVQSTNPGLLGALLQTVGGIVTSLLSNLNIRIVDVVANAADIIAADPSVTYVSLDAPVRGSGHVVTTSGAQQVRVQRNALGVTSTLDGSGVTIAILDSGIDTHHKSFSSPGKIKFSKDFTGQNRTDDPWGHGTHVAATAAGDGASTNGAFEGVAPGASLVNLRVLNSDGVGSVSGILAALDWVIGNKGTYNIRVVNMSLGTPAISSYQDDPICNAVRKLVDSGVVVVAAAGNIGRNADGQKIYGAIHCPGNEPSAITVGASNSYGTDPRNDDTVTSFSSRGPTRSFSVDQYGLKHYDNIIKPDLVAPGNKIISAEAANNQLLAEYPELETNNYSTSNMKLMYLSGTSMSTPMVSGAAALLFEANSNLTPNLVKMLLMYTAQPLENFNTFDQGAGQLNVAGAVNVAKLVNYSNGLLGIGRTTFGQNLLNSSTPAPQTTISNSTFTWTQGLILNHSTITGRDLIQKYQVSYGKGYLLGDGVNEGLATQDLNTQMWVRGLSLSSYLTRSDGSALFGGSVFFSNVILLGDGFALGDGYPMGDGFAIGDGYAMGDGFALGDGFAIGDCSTGEPGPGMR